ncbi:hypothetical protein KW795_01465 [Candidatus Microgenomates bacterium]|nr:hypothetical protein [Candidatus Microgenomates bacterium]
MPKKRLQRIDFQWSSNLAYAVGLITTDGNLSPDHRHISLTSKDVQLLKTFKQCLNIKNRICKNTKGTFPGSTYAFKVSFGNVVLYDWLIKIGLMPKKSLVIGKLKIKDKYFKDFLRGHLDGDGSIFTYIDDYSAYLNPKYVYKRLYVTFISSSENHIIWLQNKIIRLLKVTGSKSVKRSKSQVGTSNQYVIRFSKKEAIKLLNQIYYKPNLPCLKRKYNIAKPFLNFT